MKNIKEYIENTMEQYWEYLPDASKPFKDWTEIEKETYYKYTEIEKVLFFIEDKLKNLGESSSRLSAVSGCCADRYIHIKSWNIELFDDGIYACTNEHDKGDKCNYQKLSNNELHEIIEYLRNCR